MPRVAVALEYQTIPGNRFCLTPWLSQPAFLSSSISSSSCRSFVRVLAVEERPPRACEFSGAIRRRGMWSLRGQVYGVVKNGFEGQGRI